VTHQRHGAPRRLAGTLGFFALLAMLCAAPATHAAAPAAMQTYTDPAKHFTIQYPSAWHVKRDPSGLTTFYKDDPAEGTSLQIWLPTTAWKGEVDAATIMQAFLQSKAKEDPTLKITTGRQRKVNAQTTVAQIILTWTNPSKVAMRGYNEIDAQQVTGKGYTEFSFRGYQSPATAFESLQPSFGAMLKSFTITK
jgi:hypothetical protein